MLQSLSSRPWRITLHTGAFVLFLAGALCLGAWAYTRHVDGRVLPGVRIASVDIGGLTPDEARTRIEAALSAYEAQGITFTYQSESIRVSPVITAPNDPDLTYTLAAWDTTETINRAVRIGRTGAPWRQWASHLAVRLDGAVLPFVVTVDRAALGSIIDENFSDILRDAQDAHLIPTSDGSLVVSPDETGRRFLLEETERDLRTHLASLRDEPIALMLETTYPSVTAHDLAPMVDRASTLLEQAPITLTTESQTFTIDRTTLASWIQVQSANEGLFALTVKSPTAKSAIDAIAAAINAPSIDARFALENGRVTEFVAARPGKTVDVDATLHAIDAALASGAAEPITLVLRNEAPNVQTHETNTLGVVELLGTGRSNFAGSPVNRRHNIRVGAAALHGVLIPPGEEFSIVKTLGGIDAATGYLPELVIKGNRTIPEYGGGLCQVSTTAFRAALASGLPITERVAHAYVVSYYQDNGLPGVDATIYPPHPDFRFRNDTEGHILIQTRIEGNELIYDFWGMRDGRSVERTTPTVLDRRSPPPPLTVETTDIPVGERRCTERAHEGMTTVFSYTVTHADGQTNTQHFRSVYRPWQAVCLVGIAPETVVIPADAGIQGN